MTANNRRSQPGAGMDSQTVLLAVLLAGICLLTGGIYAGIHVGYWIADKQPPSAGVWETVFGVLGGDVQWLPESTIVVVAVVVLVVLALVGLALLRRRRLSRGTRVDTASRYLGRDRDIEALTEKSVAATASRLGVESSSPGIRLGLSVNQRLPLFGSWEDMLVLIAGPRTQKTTAYAVPTILSAPGACLVTSNKRDVVDATRDPRAASGQVWVFDPQSIVREPQTWWWNPLDYVTDEVQAAKLAEHFAAGSRDAGARTDAYFDSAAQDLLAGLLLAAALDDRPITDVYRWLTRPTDDVAVSILEQHGYDLTADQVAGVIQAPDKQRGGVYGTAQQMASCLTNRAATRWVTADPDSSRSRFSTDDFVRSAGTLYSLSKEGKGTAGPLVTALTVAVVEAAEALAVTSPGGRLRTPMVGVLDEAANVCRWRELPNLYSHYGSRGIILMTILQSWAQGVDVWSESGMKKLWSAANVRVYGGGVAETAFLEDLAKMVGTYDRKTASVSVNQGSGGMRSNRSISHQLTRERILDVDDLGAMPKGRALVFASGARPTLIRTEPWMIGPHAETVRASIRSNDPQAAQTLAEAEQAADVIDGSQGRS